MRCIGDIRTLLDLDAIVRAIIFARPGIGTLVYTAINHRNYPVVQAGVLVIVFLFVLVNLLVDLSYSWLDPRLSRRTTGAGSVAPS